MSWVLENCAVGGFLAFWALVNNWIVHRCKSVSWLNFRRNFTDETWVHHFTAEAKQARKKWKKNRVPGWVKTNSRLSLGKIMTTIYFECSILLYSHFLHKNRTIYAEYSCKPLSVIRLAWCRKQHRGRRDSYPKRGSSLYSSLDPKKNETTRLENNWALFCSPDLLPCDFTVFGSLKEILGDQRFNNDAEIEAYIRIWSQTQPTSFYEDPISK